MVSTMVTATKIKKWGNSLAVRIPKYLAERIALKEGSDVVVHKEREAIIIRRQEPRGSGTSKNDWRQYIIPLKRKKENVSGVIDTILYGESH